MGNQGGVGSCLTFQPLFFVQIFVFFSWGKITTLHLWDCDVTVGNFPTNESLDSYARAKRALVFLVRCFKKKDSVLNSHFGMEKLIWMFLMVFGKRPSQHVNGSFFFNFWTDLGWWKLMAALFCLVPESWYSLIGRISRIPGFLPQNTVIRSACFRGFISWVGECFVSVTGLQERVLSRLTAFWRQPGIYPLNPLRRGWYLDCKTLTVGNLFWGWTMIWW